jgi:hypothetical protein
MGKWIKLCLESSPGFDPFGGAKPRLLRRGNETPLRVNPEQAQAFRPGSRRVDFIHPLTGGIVQYGMNRLASKRAG